ncbi:uncharacterized protein [Henckelia pumila]|uniref:uncharacterized protein n=1 Tax=Henckelia pumila TaxID=405737 RepID=UPI003C6E5562
MMHIQRKHSKKLKKSLLVAHRFGLLWARKGGVFRDKLAIALTIFYQRITAINKVLHHHHSDHHQRGALNYGDRQFSFPESPMIYIKMHRPASSFPFKLPNISCVRFDFESEEDDQGIDFKAEEFIARFHEQMRLAAAAVTNI